MTESSTPPVADATEAAPNATDVRSEYPEVVDAWPGSQPFRLDGALERNGFTPIWTALLALIGAWILFQAVANIGVVVALVLQHVNSGAAQPPDAEMLLAMIGENGKLLLAWNAVGQMVGFGVLTWVFARMSSGSPGPFLRIRPPNAAGLGLATLGWMGLYPVVVWLGELSTKIPLPEWMEAMDKMRTDLIESLLLGGDLSTGFLIVTVALVPAIFEELLFRGYLQRQFERKLSVPWALVLVGFLFGAYHMSVTQLVPLSILGIYLCFVVWVTGSLWTGVLIHLLNNGLAVMVAGMARDNPNIDIESAESLGMSPYVMLLLVVLGLAAVLSVSRILLARRTVLTGGGFDAVPVSAATAPPLP